MASIIVHDLHSVVFFDQVSQGEHVAMCPQFDPEAFREFDREGHNRLAESYADVLTPITGLAVGQLLEAAGVGKGMKVLDVAGLGSP